MGPNSNQLQLQQRVRLATADCGCDCCNAHACNQCCKHLFLWLQQTGRATTILAASLLSVGMQFCGTAKVCRLPQHCSGCLVPGLYPSSASAAGHSCYPVASVVVVLVVVACTFCNQMRLTPTIVFGFSCCNIAAFYRCGKLANWQPATESWKLQVQLWDSPVVWSNRYCNGCSYRQCWCLHKPWMVIEKSQAQKTGKDYALLVYLRVNKGWKEKVTK